MRRIQNYITEKLEYYFRIDARYFFSGTVWLTIIQAITVLGALIVSVVLADKLDEASYGTYRYVLGLGAILGALSLTGMGQSIFQTASLGHTWFYEIGMKKNLIYCLGITVTSLLGALYYFIQNNFELALGCVLIALFQPLINTYQQIFPYLQGKRMFHESAMLQGYKTLVVTGVTIGTVFLTQSIFWLIGSYLLANTLTNLIVHFLYKPKSSTPVDEVVEKRYIDYAWNTSIRNIISIIAFRIDSIIVFQQLGATQLALYTIANILPEHVKGSFKNIMTLLVPKYAKHENLESIRKSIFKRSLQLLLITVVVMILYIIFSPLAYTLLFPKYHEAIFISQLVSISFPAMVAIIPLSALQAHTKESKLNKLNTQASILMITFTVGLTITQGLLGAILARIMYRYVNLVLTYYHLSRE